MLPGRSRFVAAGAVAAVTLGLSAPPATAAASATWSISPGGTTTAKSGTVALKDTALGTALTCTSSSSSITLKKGHGLPGAGIGSLTKLSFTNCAGVLGIVYKVTFKALPYKLNALSYSARTGTTTGTITGIEAMISAVNCRATVDGTAAGQHNGKVAMTYVNSTHTLTVLTSGGNLHYYNVESCFGLMKSGDSASLSFASHLSPAQQITSP